MRLVPCPADCVSSRAAWVASLVPAPLPHVALHVVGTIWSKSLMTAHSRGTFGREVAQRNYQCCQGARNFVCRQRGDDPVINGRERLSAIARVCRRFIPADPGDRIFVLTVWVCSQLPRRRSVTAG